MSITQERMIALLNEIEGIMSKVDEVKQICKAESQNPLAWEIASTLDKIQLACFWIETAHFKKHAKANMYRALKARTLRGSEATRPLLGLRPLDTNAQVKANARAIAPTTKNEMEKLIEQTLEDMQNEKQKRLEGVYEMLKAQEPTWDALKLLTEANRLIDAADAAHASATPHPTAIQPTAQMLTEKEKDRLRDEAQIPRGSLF